MFSSKCLISVTMHFPYIFLKKYKVNLQHLVSTSFYISACWLDGIKIYLSDFLQSLSHLYAWKDKKHKTIKSNTINVELQNYQIKEKCYSNFSVKFLKLSSLIIIKIELAYYYPNHYIFDLTDGKLLSTDLLFKKQPLDFLKPRVVKRNIDYIQRVTNKNHKPNTPSNPYNQKSFYNSVTVLFRQTQCSFIKTSNKRKIIFLNTEHHSR